MFLLSICLGIVLLNCLCWNMKETKLFEFSKGSVRKFRFEVKTALGGTSDDCRKLLCEFQCCPTKAGYFNLAFCLWVPYVSLSLYWGNSDLPNEKEDL